MVEIKLRKLTLNDTDNIVKWRNLPSVKRNLYSQAELKPEQHIHYFNTVVEAGKCSQFIIVVDNGVCDTDIGTVFIKNIDYESKKGEFGIFIGEESARGKGYSSFATQLILKKAFDDLELNRVYLTVMVDNTPAIKAYEKAGFKKEGIFKEDYIRNGVPVDIIEMAILKSEWKSRGKTS